MDLADIEAEVRALRSKVHDLGNRVMGLVADADADKRMHALNVPEFHRLVERVARLEEMQKDWMLMKGAVAGAVLSALAALAVALLKGG